MTKIAYPLGIAVCALLGLMITIGAEAYQIHKLKTVWYDSQQRIERLDAHVEQLEYYVNEGETQSILEQFPYPEKKRDRTPQGVVREMRKQ